MTKAFPAATGNGDRVRALEGVDMDIGAGEFVSIVGPCGCGKSTLFNMVAGLDRPPGGRILLDGRPADQLLGEIGYMPQRDLLMPWRTVLDNAALRLDPQRRRTRRGARSARWPLPALRPQRVRGRAGRRQLSGGMRQRAALLRTFLAGRE